MLTQGYEAQNDGSPLIEENQWIQSKNRTESNFVNVLGEASAFHFVDEPRTEAGHLLVVKPCTGWVGKNICDLVNRRRDGYFSRRTYEALISRHLSTILICCSCTMSHFALGFTNVLRHLGVNLPDQDSISGN